MSESPATVVGQVSADGQFRWDGTQWVPIAKGEREPTSWTRPMRMAAAALFVIDAVYSVATALIFINHDSMLKAIKAQGTQIPSGTDVDTVVSIAIGFAIGVVAFIAICELIAAVGSYLGWRWIFYAALVLFAIGGLQGLTNLGTLANPSTSPLPTGAIVISEVLALASLAMFAWLLFGLVKFGPWAMKKPGA